MPPKVRRVTPHLPVKADQKQCKGEFPSRINIPLDIKIRFKFKKEWDVRAERAIKY